MIHPKTCPDCNAHLSGRDLARQPQLRNYRTCPACGSKLVMDAATRNRQLIAIALALVSLMFTLLLFVDAGKWWPFVLLSYGIIAGFIYYAEQRVRFKLR